MEQERKAIIFIHGFMGSCRQFDGIKEKLEGCGAAFIDHVVAGHGGKAREFAKSTDVDWQEGLNGHLERLSREYDELYLVGHSMGGILAVRAAVALPEKVRGITAIAFPIKITLTFKWIGNYFQASKPQSEGEDPRITAARSLSGVQVNSFAELLSAGPNVLRFLRLTKRARQELSRLKAPLTVINAQNDEIVTLPARRFVEKTLPDTKVIIAKDSYHFLFGKADEEIMAGAVRAMLQ